MRDGGADLLVSAKLDRLSRSALDFATIKRRRRAGWSFARITDRLNDDGVPTAHGGARWYRATVRSVALRST